MVIEELFKSIKWFSPQENWGNVEKVSPELITALDIFRSAHGKPVHISPVDGAVYADNQGHLSNSWHYIIEGRNTHSMAADIFPEESLIKAWLLAIKMARFGGVGLYPFAAWQQPKKNLLGMLHLDIRPYSSKVLWWRDVSGTYHYLNDENDINAVASTMA